MQTTKQAKYSDAEIEGYKRRWSYTVMVPFEAERVAAKNQADDPDWTYTAHRGLCGISVVVVADESGMVVGLL